MAQITLNSTGVASNGALVLQSNGTTTAVTINASQGVEFNAGTAALPAITTTGDTNTGIFFPAADTIGFTEGGVEAMRIDSSGNLGLGVTPSAWATSGTILKAFQIGAAGSVAAGTVDASLQMSQNAYFDGSSWRYIQTATAGNYYISGNTHNWRIAPSGTAGNAISFTQAMTLDASGNLLLATTSQLAQGKFCISYSYANNQGIVLNETAGSAGQDAIRFNVQGTRVGGIGVTTTATTYNTSSDYRLKNSIAPMTGALAKVVALKPVTYKWNINGSTGQGFIAHELAEIVPECVVGEKDAVDAEGNPEYQGIDTSFLVATLTAAIQEQQAIIESLTQRINALEGQ